MVGFEKSFDVRSTIVQNRMLNTIIMSKFIDYSEESPESDSTIILAADIGFMDNEVAVVVKSEELALASKSWTGWYKHPRGGVYKICNDSDGYLVYKPGGGIDAWGKGYSWRDVKSGYGLAGVEKYQERRGNGCR